MKKFVLVSLVFAALIACNSNDDKGKKDSADKTQSSDYKNAMAIIGKSNCLTCHRVDEPFTGPSYVEVANKYADRADAESYLADKIIAGGSGNWGQAPMLPHPEIPMEDAKTLARYILSLKK